MKDTKTVYFLRVVEFWAIFNIQIDVTLAKFWERFQMTLFTKSTKVSQNTPTFISIGQPITK